MPGSAIVDIRNTYGAAFVGLIVSQMLWGLEIAQAWIYYWHYWNRDKKALKFLVAFLVVMDTMSTIMSTCAIYWYLVVNFNNVEGLEFRVWFINVCISNRELSYYRPPDRQWPATHATSA
ncbi:hypothetical protein V8E53_006897 [Lactarius tabidus]